MAIKMTALYFCNQAQIASVAMETQKSIDPSVSTERSLAYGAVLNAEDYSILKLDGL